MEKGLIRCFSGIGLLLWNIAFDEVLRLQLFHGCSLICYADDTLVFVSTNDVESALEIANRQVQKVIDRRSKTEVIMFSDRGAIGNRSLRIGSANIRIVNRLKYLGIILDSRLTFAPYFQYVEDKVCRVMEALGRFMPNLRGPSESKRKLFYNALLSIVLYGAPVWHRELSACRSGKLCLRRVQRLIARRVICAYRTVSYDAACLLAGVPPVPILASGRARVFERMAELKLSGEWSVPRVNQIRREEQARMMELWLERLNDEHIPGARTKRAIYPNLKMWMERAHGGLTYRMTQVPTGHGCQIFVSNKKAEYGAMCTVWAGC